MISKLPLFLLLIFSSVVHRTRLSAQGLIISNGGNLVVNGAANIVINNGGFSNAGVFNAGSGTVTFTGATTASIAGTGTTSFYNFLIDKSSSKIGLLRNIDVTNLLTLGNGNIDLNGFDVNLGTTGSIIGERPASRVLGPAGGFLIKSAVLNAPVNVNPGNIGVGITTTSNPGLTVIKRGHLSLQIPGSFSIQRFFDISAANNTGANSTLRFYYFDEELGIVAENELGVYSLTPSFPGGKSETPAGSDPVANYVQISNVGLTARFVPARITTDPSRPFEVYPNPTTGLISVRFRSANNQQIILQVVDNTGKVIAQKEVSAVAGLNIISYDLSTLAQGIYYLRVENFGKKAVKIFKQ